jgi:hypothetical protein
MIFKYKKGFLLRDFVIVGMLFGLIIALYVLSVAGIANNYQNTNIISENFASHYSHLQDNLNSLDTSYKATKGSGGLNLIGAFNVAFNSVFTVIIMVWDGITLYSGMAGTIVSDFTFLDSGVITIFLSAIIAMLTAYLVFVWLSSVMRGKI